MIYDFLFNAQKPKQIKIYILKIALHVYIVVSSKYQQEEKEEEK
jgi:hypothetical protein